MTPEYNLSKKELRTLLTLNGKSLPLNRIEEKCNLDYIGAKNILKNLISFGLIDVETWNKRTLFKLSDTGIELAKVEYEKRKLGGNYGAIIGIIGGKERIFENKAIRYLKSILSNYNDGEYLLNEHIDFIITCLGKSELGQNLINDGIVKIRVIHGGKNYAIEVITKSLCTTIPVNRIFGEKTKHNHEADVRNCFYWALQPREQLPEGLVRFHDNPSYGELINGFLTEERLSFDDIQVIRSDGHRQFADETIGSRWKSYYLKHANVIIITKEAMNIIGQQKRKTEVKQV